MTPTTVDHLYVDTTRGERIKINLNVTFPNMPRRARVSLRWTWQASSRSMS